MAILYILLPFLFSMPQLDSDPGRYILQFQSSAVAEEFFETMSQERFQLEKESIFSSKHIYSVSVNGTEDQIRNFEEDLNNDNRVAEWQYDREITLRNTTPNDPLFSEQWYHTKIESHKAWDLTQGGLTADSQEIVIAVLDDGFETNHPDIIENRWVNKGEIQGDGIDNDNNGFVDDFLGLNVITNNDDHVIKEHGLQVAGIIGGRGDNSLGIAGVNWKVKILFISGVNTESRVIKGMNYIYELRKKYNNTNGQQGAFVVVSNLSAGVNNAFPEDHPMWCSAYDQLGQEGILNVVAATNDETNVDEDGDIPTLCPSDYMIALTISNKGNNRITPSAFGLLNVDLAAPGTGILTTDLGGDYDQFQGTSAAAPQVAGAVALLYSTPCEEFIELVNNNPAAGALLVKAAILENVDKYSDFEGTTVSGGRLNINNSMLAISSGCEIEERELQIFELSPNPTRNRVNVYFQTPGDGAYMLRLFDMSGRQINEIAVPNSLLEMEERYFDVDGLAVGTYVITLSQGKNQKVSKRFVVY